MGFRIGPFYFHTRRHYRRRLTKRQRQARGRIAIAVFTCGLSELARVAFRHRR